MAEDASFLNDVENFVAVPELLGASYASDTVEIYTNTTLHRPESIRDALEAYCRYSGALFYLFPLDEIRELYKRVYWTAGGASRGTLCALCALASLGYHYDVEYADLQIIQKFYNTAKLYLDVCLEEDRVYGMRVMVLLAANCIMEKRTAAWYWIKSAMDIAKERGFATSVWDDDEDGKSERVVLQKNWMTTVFFHTWLTATIQSHHLELPYDVHDVVLLAARIKSIASSRVDMIRSELHSIGIILCGILQGTPRRGEVSLRKIRTHAAETEAWVSGLPDFMQLASLLVENAPTTNMQRRTTLLVHILFQGAQMQLHRPTMLYLAEIHRDSPWVLDGTRDQAAESADTCVRSALQTAQIVNILMSENSVFKRCWIVIHQSFVAGLILIFSASQKKKHGIPNEEYGDELGRVDVCLRALEFCGTIDRMAQGYCARLLLYYEVLLRPSNPRNDSHATTSNAAMSEISEAATLMAQHPRYQLETFDQPFFDEIDQETEGWQEGLPQWLAEDDEMMSLPSPNFPDGLEDGED